MAEVQIKVTAETWTEVKIAVIDVQLALTSEGFTFTRLQAKPREHACELTFQR